MNLYELRPVEDENGGYWRGHFDTAHGFIIAADTEEEARALADDDNGCEEFHFGTRTPWQDPKLTTARIIGTTAAGVEPGIIMCDFNAG